MNKIILILLVFTSLLKANLERNFGVITGKITDAATGQPVPFATVTLVGTTLGAAADVDGNYRITNLVPGTYQVRATVIGYNTITKTDVAVNNSKPAQVDFQLQQLTIELEDVTVTSSYFYRAPTDLNSVKSFGYEEIRRAPGGFEDVVRALSILPGVAQVDAGRNDLIVRGGAPSENLYVVDGFEVPNINHFGTQGATGGPLSFINLDYVKETSFSTGGFPVLYGDKLSSVLRIDLRDGRSDRLGGKAVISASQFGLNLEGPVTSNSNFLFSARRSYLDFIFKAAGFGFVPEYYDVLSKFNYDIDKKTQLNFLFVSAFDNVKYFNDTDDKRLSNSRVLGSDQVQYLTGLSYRQLFNKGFYRISLSRNFVDYNTSQRDSLLNPIFLNESREGENKLKAEVVYQINPALEINAGGDVEHIKFKSNIIFPANFVTTFGDTLPISTINTTNVFFKYSLFGNLTTTLMKRIILNTGVRMDYFDAINEKYYLSPRASLSYMFNELTSLNLSGGMYYQSPSYIWLAAGDFNRNLTKIRVDQYIVGLDHVLREDTRIKLEAFYKDYRDYPASLLRPYLVLANTGAGFAGSEDGFSAFGLEPLVNAGKGYSRGIEFSAQKKLSDIPVYGILSATYNQTRFTAIDGIERRGSYDQNWIFNISGGYQITETLEASMKFRYSTGRPVTPFNPDGTQSVSLYNTLTLDPLHSLDLRVDKKWFFDRLTLITYLDVQNVYNRQNLNTLRWNPREKKVEESANIGILPSIGISLEF
ncbi:MAG: TonB-dependent receptor [Ignavibacteriaceae bacterium]|nr:TonB-dependent receptor [Ignavibacteriaceae bacterium]